MMSSYFCISSGLFLILLTRDFNLPSAIALLSGRSGCSFFHGHVTVYLPSSYFRVSLNFFSATSLSDSTGESFIPTDSYFQKSSKFGFIGSDLSRHVRKVVSLSTPLPWVIISTLDSVGFSSISEVRPERIHPSFEPSM